MQVAASSPIPQASQWSSLVSTDDYGPAAPQTADFANKFESIVASGLPTAVSQLYGTETAPLTADKVLEFLQGIPFKVASAFSACLPHCQMQQAISLHNTCGMQQRHHAADIDISCKLHAFVACNITDTSHAYAEHVAWVKFVTQLQLRFQPLEFN